MGSTGAPSLVPTSSSSSSLSRTFTFPSDVKGVLRIWESVISSTLDRYRNGTVNWSQVVFLTTCFVAMAGCGFLSSLLRRRGSQQPSGGRGRRFGRSARKNDRKSSAGAMSSSDEDEYDSNASLRPGTDGSLIEKDATAQHHEQSVEGQSYPFCLSLRCDLILTKTALTTDPGLLKKYSSYHSYSTSVATYPSIRTFFCQHPQMSKLPTKPSPIPLLVFVHGLGGSLAQFHHLLTSLTNIAPCFGIDLPGCGLSTFEPTSWDAYTVEALADLIATAIEQHRDVEAGQGVVLVSHSLGCSLSALLASSASPIGAQLKEHIIGTISVCPRASPPPPKDTTLFRRLLYIPNPVFNLWRTWDRRGGPNSASVARFVGADADPETRELQVRFNKQSKTAVWRRMAWGTLPTQYDNDKPVGGMPGEEVWAGIQSPVLLIAGESDAVTKASELKKILQFFGDIKPDEKIEPDSSVVPDATRVQDQIQIPVNGQAHEVEYGGEEETEKVSEGKLKRPVKTAILPAPASHALLYDRATYRTVSGIIQDFFVSHIDHRLSLGWQLHHLNTSGKWDVKNVAKWKKVTPVSQPLADTFVALKMLREVDEEHNPVRFSEQHRNNVYAIIDISHENPVYNPASLEKGGIHYQKHPTVSKIPPTPDETRDFIALVDRLQAEITDLVEKRPESERHLPRPVVGVHCHYGFNRTGFLIVCYLIERRGFGVQEAIDEFERRRAPGIRHGHFLDTLFVRYCVGLKRAPTL